MDELKLLISKGWVPHTLRDWWDYYQTIGVRNICCEGLRRVGKTATIHILVQELFERALEIGGNSITNLPILLVPNENVGRLYKELYKKDKIRFIVKSSQLKHGYYRGYTNPILSDEVPDAEHIVNRTGFSRYYIGGFYS